jgi:hypothetical protein
MPNFTSGNDLTQEYGDEVRGGERNHRSDVIHMAGSGLAAMKSADSVSSAHSRDEFATANSS